MPGVRWQPLAANWSSQGRMRGHDFVCIHTMVGGLIGTDGYFRLGNGRGYAGTESHYGTGGLGEKVQWQDTAYRADANLDGNGEVISIENADMGPGFPSWDTRSADNVPAFTDDQVEAIAEIVAWECSKAAHKACPSSWACHQHGIPLDLVPDTKPGRRGVAYHRQGVDPYRVSGGVRWSSSYGKGCPGPARIRQITADIIPRARQIAGASPTPGGLFVSLSEKEEREVLTRLRSIDGNTSWLDQTVIRGKTLAQALREVHQGVEELTRVYDGLPENEAGEPIVTVDPVGFIRYIDRHAYELNREKLPQVLATLDELVAAVDALRAQPAPAGEAPAVESPAQG